MLATHCCKDSLPFKVLLATLTALALLAVPAPSSGQSLPGETEDPFNQIHQMVLKEGRVVSRSSSELPLEAFSSRPGERKPEEAREERPVGKIHPELLAMKLEDDARSRLLITFRDDLKMPRFPEKFAGEAADSPANRAALSRAKELIEGIEAKRADSYAKLRRELEAGYQAKVLETFWLVKAMLVEMPLSRVRALADRPDVQAVEPEVTRDLPPQNGNNLDDVQDGRAHIASDAYFNMGLTSGFIALLDTGVRSTHVLLKNPSHLSFLGDCVNGGANCSAGIGFNPNDDCWNHGTASAGILTANLNKADAFRGVTGIMVDSFKVYGAGCGGLNQTAVVRGFQKAVAFLDRVILAEIQASGAMGGVIETSADQAFNANFLVIAANGNAGPAAGTVNSPASAHKAVGVGALTVQGLVQVDAQSRGPAPDGRIKPDIQAPTSTETAGSTSDVAFKIHPLTSGAAPYAAGAAALLRNWSLLKNASIDAGQVYSQIILSGHVAYPQINNTTGVGLLTLPIGGLVWYGKVSVANGKSVDIPLLNSSGQNLTVLHAALWWPESAAQSHNDIDLHLVEPFGAELAHSTSSSSVFERAQLLAILPPLTTWKVRIQGYSVPVGPQTVYWAAWMH